MFFVIFHVTFLAYKLIHNDKFNAGDIALMAVNSFVFYGIGFSQIDDFNTAE